jgi:HTH-type transcriptional repressor of puuD
MAKTDLGSLVRERRLAKGWTQRDLARAAGVSRRTVQYIESNRVKPHVSTLRRLIKLTR